MNGESRNRSGGPVPPRWLKCPRKSDFIGQKFLVFKTPLDESFDDKVPAQYRFHPTMILEYMKMQRVGAFIRILRLHICSCLPTAILKPNQA